MTSERIAGHDFDPITSRCTGTVGLGDDARIGGVHWHMIMNADDADIDKEGVAHVGKLNRMELAQIQVRKAREQEAIDVAMQGARDG